MRSSGAFPDAFSASSAARRAAQTRDDVDELLVADAKTGSPRSFGRSSILDRGMLLVEGRAVSLPSFDDHSWFKVGTVAGQERFHRVERGDVALFHCAAYLQVRF